MADGFLQEFRFYRCSTLKYIYTLIQDTLFTQKFSYVRQRIIAQTLTRLLKNAKNRIEPKMTHYTKRNFSSFYL